MTDSPVHTALLQILARQSAPNAKEHWAGLADSEWADLEQTADTQRVGALLHFCLQHAPAACPQPPETLRRDLADRYRQSVLRNLFLAAELAELAQALKARNIPCLALKGMHLAHDIYPEIGTRQMDDIDLLVPREMLAEAVQVTRELAYITREPMDIEAWSADVHHLPRMYNNNNTILELHWNITWPKDRYALSDLDGLWARAMPIEGTRGQVLGLCPEDLILHLCIHAAYQHLFYTGLRPVCDISAVIARYGESLDWHALETRALNWGWQSGVFLMLNLARTTLGARVPDRVLAALRADIPDEAADAARYLLWNITSDAITLPRNMARMWSRGSRREKLRDLVTALFPSRARLAKEYTLRAGSPLVWLHYPRFVVDLAVRNYSAWRSLQQADPAARRMAVSKNLLLESLYGE